MLSIKVKSAVPLDNLKVLIFFENGKVKKFDVEKLFSDYPEYRALEDPRLFRSLKVEPGGYGISWNEDLDCSEGELYECGKDVHLTLEDFCSFAEHNLITTKEASEIIGCTKQNIDDLVLRGKLHPIKYNDRYKLFLRSEVEKRTW